MMIRGVSLIKSRIICFIKAAFNVGGVTIHRLFQLPIEHNSKTAGYWSLPKTSQKVMKTSLRNVKIIIIDEVSMVSSLNLAYIHLSHLMSQWRS